MIDRYTRTNMKRIFSEQNKFKCWLDVELAAVKAWEELGHIPRGTYERIKKKAKFTIKGIQDIEKTTNHDMIAFTTEVAKSLGEDSKWIHLGLTSNDVVDTAQALFLKEACEGVLDETENLAKVLKDQALKHKDTLIMGRTHGMHAEPTTLGLKAAVWYDEIRRNIERLKDASKGVAVGKLSGAVGNFAHCPPELEEIVMRELGIGTEPASTQVVQRDRHAYLLSVLAVLGGTLEKIAVTLRTLQRTEIGEVAEPFGRGQKGSSAMPHKRNPITLERICGLARLLRANAIAAMENQALWDERDISHSSVERVILADSLTLADYMIERLTYVVKNLDINTRKMEENIRETKGLQFSQTVLLALVEKGMLRERAYELVQRNAMKTHSEGTPFYDNLLKDSDVTNVMDRNELAECFSNRHFSRYADYVLARVGIIEGGKPEPQQQPKQQQKQVSVEPPKSKPVAPRNARTSRTQAKQKAEDVKEQKYLKAPAEEQKPEAKKAPAANAQPATLKRTSYVVETQKPVNRAPLPIQEPEPIERHAPQPPREPLEDPAKKRRGRPRRTRRVAPVEPQPGNSRIEPQPGNSRIEPKRPPAPERVQHNYEEDEDRQPPQLNDWRLNPTGRSVVDGAQRRPSNQRGGPRKKR